MDDERIHTDATGAPLRDAADVDASVDRWHEGDASPNHTLADHLGMTRDQYARWVFSPEALDDILAEISAEQAVDAAADQPSDGRVYGRRTGIL